MNAIVLPLPVIAEPMTSLPAIDSGRDFSLNRAWARRSRSGFDGFEQFGAEPQAGKRHGVLMKV